MGIPDGAHTHGSGGGLGTVVLVVLGAALAVKLAGPVVASVGELFHVLVIAAGVIVGVSATALGACSHGGGATGRPARPAPCPRFHRRWRGPLRRSRRRGAPTPYPANPHVNCPAAFICTPWRQFGTHRRHPRPAGPAATGGKPARPAARPLAAADRRELAAARRGRTGRCGLPKAARADEAGTPARPIQTASVLRAHRPP
jgi:hypothetical protein